MHPKRSATLPIIIAGLALLALYIRLAFITNAVDEVSLYLSIFGIAFAIYLFCLYWTRRTRPDGKSIWLILGFALAFRVVFIGVWPSISTDFYRYVWDGHVAKAGINPYAYPPNDRELKHLRTDYWRRLSYKRWQTPYPPGAQLVFKTAYKLKPDSQIPLKATFILFDMATILLLLRLLGALGLPRSWLIVYAWSPLIVTEFASSGHVDAMGVMAMTLALTLSVTQGRKSVSGPAALAWSAALKPFAIPLIPMFVRRHGWKALVAGAVVLLALIAPYAGHWREILATPQSMAKETHVNTSLFNVFEMIGDWFGADPGAFARAAGGLLVACFALWPALRGKTDDKRLLNSAMATVGVTLLVSPLVYPWYTAWIIPFLCFSLNPAWLLFTGLVAVSYLLPFYEWALWIRLVQYVPFYGILLAVGVWRRRRAVSSSEHAASGRP
ncbi:MAG: glycosyltransferase 87 family protein [Armatimonadota bacterium]|nr:glycosyltransferase 87 family protein [Armatimonadota bacterium]